jgi:anti-sigma regulatory factor (Ser/Thr protein kinase)
LYDLPDQFEITAHPRNAGPARERIREAAVHAGFHEMDLADIEIAVGEAVTNAILYGSPTASSRVVLSYGLAAPGFVIQIRDEGQGFDPSHVRMEEDTDALGGRGIRLMRALMDQVDLHYDGHGMIACLIKKLPAKTSAS